MSTDTPAPTAATAERAASDPRCGLTLVADPSRELGAPTWTACGDGCRRMQTPWTSATRYTLATHGPEPVRRVGAKALLTYTRHGGDPDTPVIEEWIHVVTPLDDAAVFGLRSDPEAPDGCAARVAVGERGVAAIVHTAFARTDELWHRDADGNTTRVALPGLARDLAVGEATMWVDVEGQGLFAIDGRDVRAVLGLAATRPRALGQGMVAQAFDRTTLVGATEGGAVPWQVAPRDLAEVAVDRARDGLWWVDAELGDDGRYHDAVLWHAAPGTGVAQQIAALPDHIGRGGAGLVADDGLVLALDDGARAHVTWAPGGELVAIAPPEGLQWLRPLWIDARAAWLLAGPTDDPDGRASTIVQQQWTTAIGDPG